MNSVSKSAVRFAGVIAIAARTVSEARAQISDAQDFTVMVTPELTITAPAGVSITTTGRMPTKFRHSPPGRGL